MKKVGEHVTIDFLGVKRDYAPDFYNKVIYKIAKKAKIEVINIAEKIFKPQGYTCLALLAESHMSFHTFPEKGIISFDFLHVERSHLLQHWISSKRRLNTKELW